jgi:Ca-activated chloride channel family protein
VAPGQTLRLEVDAVEATKEVSVYGEPFGDTQHLLETRDGLRFTRELMVPAGTGPGEYELVLVARDAAGNRFERREKVRVALTVEE